MKLLTVSIGTIGLGLQYYAVSGTDLSFKFLNSKDLSKLLNPNLLEHPSIMARIGQQIKDGRVVVIRNAFRPDFAEAVYQELERAPFEVDQDFHPRGSHHFFHRLDTDMLHHYPILNATFEVFNSDETKEYMSELTGRDCMGEATVRGEHYQRGDHSLPTPDFVDQRTVAFDWHLAKNWNSEWGGALYWCQEVALFSHLHATFNTLILYSVTKDFSHFVTPVTRDAYGKRLSLTGWWNSAWVPNIDDDYEHILEAWRNNMTEFQYKASKSIIESDDFVTSRRESLEYLLWQAQESLLRPYQGTYEFGEEVASGIQENEHFETHGEGDEL